MIHGLHQRSAPRTRVVALFAWAAALAAADAVHAAADDPLPPIRVAGTNDRCPAVSAVVLALRQRFKGADISAGTAAPGAVQVSLRDRAGRYDVRLRAATLAKHMRFAEPRRDCASRARNAAVAIDVVLTVQWRRRLEQLAEAGAILTAVPPPPVPVPVPEPVPPLPPPPPLPPADPPPVAPAPVVRAFPWVDIEAGGLLYAAPTAGTGAGSLAGGASLRAALGWRWIGASLGISGLSPIDLRVEIPGRDARVVSLQRIPIDVGVRFRGRRGRVAGSIDLGFQAATLLTQGAVRFEPAIFLGITGRVVAWERLEPFLSLGLVVPPRPLAIRVTETPAGGGAEVLLTEAMAPQAWISITLGLAIRAR